MTDPRADAVAALAEALAYAGYPGIPPTLLWRVLAEFGYVKLDPETLAAALGEAVHATKLCKDDGPFHSIAHPDEDSDLGIRLATDIIARLTATGSTEPCDCPGRESSEGSEAVRMTPTDDRGAAALAERLCMAQERNDLAHVADTTATWWREVAAHALGERGRFLPDGDDAGTDRFWQELTRLRKVEAAARAVLPENAVGRSVPYDALRAALESDQ